MKKIYSLIAMAAVALSSYAAIPAASDIQLKADQITPEGKQYLASQMARMQVNAQLGIQDENAVTRSYTDANDVTWYITVVNNEMQWVDMLWEEGKGPTFEQFPYWVAFFYVSNSNNSQLVYPLFWPANVLIADKLPENPEDYDLTPAPFEALAGVEGLNEFWISRYNESSESWTPGAIVEDGELLAWGIYPFAPGYGSCVYNNVAVGPVWNATSNSSKKTTITLEEYVSATNYAEISLQLFITGIDTSGLSTGKNQATIRLAPFKGDIWLSGFTPKGYSLELSDVHIFNAGETSSDDNFKYMTREGDDWGPVQQYFYVMSGPQLSIIYDEGAFNANNVSFQYKIENSTSTDVTYIIGMAYGEPGNVTPKAGDNFFLQLDDYDDDGQNFEVWNVPAVGTILPYYSVTGYKDEGLLSVYEGHVFNASSVNLTEFIPANTYILTTSPDGLVAHIATATHDELHASYKGNITLHPDAADMSKTETLAAVSTENTQVEDLVVNNNAPAVVYDLNGRIVNTNNLNPGLYIIRTGNKAQKVLVK